MNISTGKLITIALSAGLLLSGCSANTVGSSPNPNEESSGISQLSQADAQRLATSPKVEGYIMDPTLASSFAKGGMIINVLGRISNIYAPRSSCMDDGEACFEYIPVEIEVLASLPALGESKIVLRSWPTAEFAEDPRLLKVGDIVMANPVDQTTDSGGFTAYSLGNIFEVDSEGIIRDYSKAADPLGTLSDVDQILGTHFENKFQAVR